MKLLTLPAVLLCAVLPAFSDSFNVFVAQPVPPFHILMDPNGNPLLQQSFRDGGSNILEFFVDLPLGATFTLGANFTIADKQFPLTTLTGMCPPAQPGCFTFEAWAVPYFTKTVDGVLTLTLNGESETFKFRYFTTVTPEQPASHCWV